MPRYFFDVQSQSGLVCQDHQGLDCADDVGALAEARHGAGFTSYGDCARNPQLIRYRFVVADEAHHELFTVPFSELEPDGDAPSPDKDQLPASTSAQKRL